MKTFYLIKSFLPFVFLPIAPGVIQVELERRGLLTYGSSAFFTILMQVIFTLGIIVWLARVVNQKNKTKAFLRMSCVSKKVFYQGRWISVEQYLADYHNVVVSHGMTPEESTAWVHESEEWLRREAVRFVPVSAIITKLASGTPKGVNLETTN
jgi:hypothetical protein